jgi:hypothetical protein
LISVRDGAGEHNHVACSTEEDNVLDVYGWWTRVAYIKEEGADLGIGFYPLELDELKKQFVSGRGKGFYVHPDFEDPARDRAKRWIEAYRAYYDGTNKCPIPGLSRVKKASGSHIHSVFREDPASSKSGG